MSACSFAMKGKAVSVLVRPKKPHPFVSSNLLESQAAQGVFHVAVQKMPEKIPTRLLFSKRIRRKLQGLGICEGDYFSITFAPPTSAEAELQLEAENLNLCLPTGVKPPNSGTP